MAGPDACCLLAQTNNPRKLQVLEELGVNVTGRIPCIVESQELNVGYLATKQVCTCSADSCNCRNAMQPPGPALSLCVSTLYGWEALIICTTT